MNLMNIKITTSRLTLEPISLKDAEEIFREFTSEITTFMYPKSPDQISETEDFIKNSLEKMKARKNLQMVIFKKDGGEFLGCTGIHSLNTNTPELGIWIKKSAHGHGFGQEAVATLKEWAEQNLDYRYLKYPVDKRNFPSRKIPESLGGIIEDQYKKPNQIGKILDEVEYRIYKMN